MVSVPQSVKEPERCHAICATGTLNLLEAAAAASVRRVVVEGESGDFCLVRDHFDPFVDEQPGYRLGRRGRPPASEVRADGEPLMSGNQTFDAKALFDARNTGNNYQEATGWASETLVIINTVRQNGEKGPSYWLEVPSGAIIPLSTQF